MLIDLNFIKTTLNGIRTWVEKRLLEVDGRINAVDSKIHTPDYIELTSPNGTRYRFTVSDDGTLSAAVVQE